MQEEILICVANDSLKTVSLNDVIMKLIPAVICPESSRIIKFKVDEKVVPVVSYHGKFHYL